MADNLVLSAGTEDGATIATDDITAVHYPISKLAHGALDSATIVSTSSGLPVQQQGTWNVTEASGSAIATDLAAIEVLLTTLNSLITTIDGVLDAIDAGKLEEATFTGRIGEVQDSPTQYTVLERLKVIATALAGTLTVSGTVDLGATDNAVLDNIDADLTTLIGHVDGLETLIGTTNTTLTTIDGRVDGIEGLLTTIDADTGNLAGMATSLSNIDTDATTIIGHLDGVETLLGTIDTDTGNIATSVAVMDDWDESDRAKVNSQEVSGVMIENAVAVTVKYAAIDAASSGDNTIVAAVSGKKIRVLSLFLVSSGTVNVRFENGAGGTALTGQMNLVANTGFVLPHNPHGWFQCGTDNTLLNLELNGAVSVDGALTYIEAE